MQSALTRLVFARPSKPGIYPPTSPFWQQIRLVSTLAHSQQALQFRKRYATPHGLLGGLIGSVLLGLGFWTIRKTDAELCDDDSNLPTLLLPGDEADLSGSYGRKKQADMLAVEQTSASTQGLEPYQFCPCPPASLFIRKALAQAPSRGIQQAQAYQQTHVIGFDERVLPGFRDGGRFLPLNADGSPARPPYREILVVKPLNEDLALQRAIDDVARHFQAHPEFTELDRIAYLKQYIEGHLSGEKNPAIQRFFIEHGAVPEEDTVPAFCPGQEVSPGQLLESGAGLCRHRALVTKVMADHLGLSAQLVRGNYGEGGHCWNVFRYGDHQRVLVDTMLNKLLSLGSGVAQIHAATRYKSVDGRALYESLPTPEGLSK